MDNFRIDTLASTLVIGCAIGTSPCVLYWGQRLADDVGLDQVITLGTRQGAPGMPDVALSPSLAMEPSLGFGTPCGFSAHRNGKDWGSLFLIKSAHATDHELTLVCADSQTQMTLHYRVNVDTITGTFSLGAVLTNDGEDTLDLVDMATACLPVGQTMREIIGFTGRWAQEFQVERVSRFTGTYLRENRYGRHSHGGFPALILCAPQTNETQGEAYGFHLAWSGNHRLRVDSLIDGRGFVSLGALLFPGEIRLAPGAQFIAPDIIASYSPKGLSGLSQNFHAYARQSVLRASTRARARPVHYNTWEAVYFNHDQERLKQLATRASELGVERFVLDDGWFGGRRNDGAGLGDWVVSDAVYPDGLKPLVDHVTGLGMEMGIWFEPEMVNPDSDLYRAHPDWVLCVPGIAQIPYRNQYVLDLVKPEVSDYLFAQIDAILRDHDIGYIKWDMNRDISHPGDDKGFAKSHAHVLALYALLDRVRAAHPNVEIESCSSGGGRADFGVLAHTDRVWTSDSNDALDRQAIQRGASHFLPLDVMGAHVGPRHCHITGRTMSMAMRAGTALMGHMGLELNLLDEPEAELSVLKTAIELYKQHRAVLHRGDMIRLDTSQHLNCVGVVSADKDEALFSVAFVHTQMAILPDRLHFHGLDQDTKYQIFVVWPQNQPPLLGPSFVTALERVNGGGPLSGDALMKVGLQLPLTRPETVLLLHLKAVAA